ncbi:MarR family transcriptional regulator [Chelatococcus daeguensis]|uniref:MarR family winged helix-turn-helix transcriptional regulator n=1 Tax=Chelatococcus daeguensis TaxID=444444 RepID=UPI0007AB3088|nr:transcriptional regulator [Chelatococcus daeguensis]MBM3085743.1 MarR family transcriptional regulator [Chelatococcus daeguensis]
MSGALAEAPPAAAIDPVETQSCFDVIELLFFAYRDFVSDPDRILTDYGFGRAHHRVLHFVNRQPGLTIAELLDILRITKQSLNRVLKELVEKGFVEQRTGVQDRRQRLLFPTVKGRDLALALSRLQGERIRRAIERCGEDDRQAALRFLFAMIDENDRDHVARLVYGAGQRKGQ